MSIAFPGYVPDVHAADALDPAWGNAIRDRAPQVFTTQATLTAAVTSPQVGQSAVITVGTGAFTGMASPGEYIYAGATDGWRPPWNSGWGEVARTVDTTAQSNAAATEVVVTAAATAFTAVANRLYRIRINGAARNLNAATQVLTFRVKDGVTLIEQARPVQAVAVNTGPGQFVVEVEIGTLTAGAHTINLTIQSANASGWDVYTSVLVPIVVTVDDIGPAGAPS